ncbi:MAG: hypothetical protein CR991_05515 [Proteobacteria bacterium]|nr:MAG: hypothetical protein CR991_05515 [Pseudomonadota bacterium]
MHQHLKENPRLKSKLSEIIESAYDYAITGAVRETGLTPKTFPESCPWTFETFMDNQFWPETV